MNPHVACRDKWWRIEALQRNRDFPRRQRTVELLNSLAHLPLL